MRFGFVVHPLTPFQQRLIGVRSADPELLRNRDSLRPPGRVISHLRLERPGAPPVEGLLAAIPTLPEPLLAEQSAGVTDILDAVRLCREAGAGVVGLGAVTAVVGGQGKAVAEASPCGVTSGNALTTWAAVETWARFSELVGHPSPVGLYGLPGAVAGGILQLLVHRGDSVLAVVDRPATPLTRLAERLNASGPGRVRFVRTAAEVVGAGHVLIAASSTGGRLSLGALPHGAVVIDVAAPVDVLFDVPPREDVLLLDGEMVRLPGRLRGTEPWQTLYGLVTGQGERIFACFAEPMLLAGAERPDLATTGRDLTLERLRALAALAEASGFSVDVLCARGRPVRAARTLAFAERVRRTRSRAAGGLPPPP
jgi:predicted amino acid dehydrogenase